MLWGVDGVTRGGVGWCGELMTCRESSGGRGDRGRGEVGMMYVGVAVI